MARHLLEPSAPERRRTRRASFWVGLALVTAGCVLLGYTGWQLLGTNVVSQRKQARIVAETVRAWSRPPPAPVPEQRRPRPAPGIAKALLRVPAFGKDYRVPVQEGVGDRVLAEGLGHFPGTAGPGDVGNFALAGHRVTHGEPLRDLPTLRPGNTVVVETRDRSFTYRLDTDPRDLIVTFRDVWVVADLPRNPDGGVQPAQRPGQRLITLTTCSELFHTDNRMIAFGHLVGSRPRSKR